MRAFRFSPGTVARVDQTVAYARENPIPLDVVLRAAAYDDAHFTTAHVKGCCLDLDGGFRTCFTFEHHRPGLYRHLAVALDTPGLYASPAALRGLLGLYGFRRRLEDCTVYASPGLFPRVDVYEPVTGSHGTREGIGHVD